MVLMAVFTALLIAEVTMRFRAPLGHEAMLFGSPDFSHPDLYVEDQELHLLPSAGFSGSVRTLEYSTTVNINSLGTRGAELAPKEEHELRLLSLGDSFTLGVQVEDNETFSALIERGLSNRLSRPVTILNAGVDGFGTTQAAILADRLAETTDIDGLILTFFTGNDFWDNGHYAPMNYTPQLEGQPPPAPTLSPLDQVLGRISYLYAWIKVNRNARALRSNPPRIQRYSNELRIFVTGDETLRRTINPTTAALNRLKRLCDERVWRCFVAIAPPAFVVHSERLSSTFDLVDIDPSGVDPLLPNRVASEAAQAHFPTIDLSTALIDAGTEEALYYRFDGHWNRAGHRVVADTLTPWLAGLLTENEPDVGN